MVGILRLPGRCAADQSRRCEANAPSLDSANGTASARQHWIVKDARKVEIRRGEMGCFYVISDLVFMFHYFCSFETEICKVLFCLSLSFVQSCAVWRRSQGQKH